jgi:hypothetical protein
VRSESFSKCFDQIPLIDEKHSARIQGIILRLSEALENKETIFE